MIVVSGLAVNRYGTGRVLMGLRRQGKLRPSMWEYPGGKVEPGESDQDALRREWNEELMLDVEVGETISQVSFEVEERIDLMLFHVTFPEYSRTVSLDHERMEWITPLEAIQYRPCTPSTYLVYRDVVRFVERIGRLKP